MSGQASRVALLFSGGVDSTVAAMRLAESYERIDLLSFHHDYGQYKIRRTARRAAELQRHFPHTFSHRIISIRRAFEQLVLDSLEADYRKYRSGFIWCMGCKIVMQTRTIIHCLDNDIRVAADGSSGETSEMVEQQPASVAKLRAFHGEYGISFITPLYDAGRAESINFLVEKGFKLGPRLGDRFLGIQPKCRPGELYYLPFLLLGAPPDHAEERVAAFIDEKLAMARKQIAARPAARPGEGDAAG